MAKLLDEAAIRDWVTALNQERQRLALLIREVYETVKQAQVKLYELQSWYDAAFDESEALAHVLVVLVGRYRGWRG